jgi:hypothetical protein
MSPEPANKLSEQWGDIECPRCGRLLFKSCGTTIEIHCRTKACKNILIRFEYNTETNGYKLLGFKPVDSEREKYII